MLVVSHQLPKQSLDDQQLCQIGHFRYSLADKIGQGFSSKVYKGINLLTNKQVAIKVINTDILTEPINVTLLEFQLQILSKMNNCPYILEMHSIIKQSRQTYIITEICFTDLSKLLKPALPIQLVELYTEQLIQGFYQIYKKDIIHRDLKPANLLIDAEGNLKIADFGFAIKASEARKQTKFNIGSPLYMSPEALKRNDYSFKSDVWSIGASVFEMLTGDTPWNAENQEELYQNYESIRIEQILAKQKFPPLLHNLLTKTLQFDRRYRISPQQLFLLKIREQKIQQQQSKPVEVQVPHNEYYLPRGQKTTKTQKFQKPSKNSTAQIHKTAKSTKQEQSSVSIRPVIRKVFNTEQKIEQGKSKTILNIEEQGKYNTDTKQQKQSTTLNSENTCLEKLTKQETKQITKKLVYCLHICRLLFKILVRVNECIDSSANQNIVASLSKAKENVFRHYCSLIVKHMHQIKNFSNNNFLALQKHHFDEYVLSSDHKKLKKICGEYIERYSKSEELKFLWVQRQEPDYGVSAIQTVNLIAKLWPELCQKNHEQIILLEFLVFLREVIPVLEQPKSMGTPKTEIQNYVDTIPNPPSMNRFKQAITKAKKISGQKLKQEKCQ